MEMATGQGEAAAGDMLVPWPSWEQWKLVRESLFSSSPHSVAAALDRIRGWRSRGRVPVAIQITAAIVEIQQKDPFFSGDLVGEMVYSEEMLSMLYSTTITRLVNGFVEKVHGYNNHAQKHALGKGKQSISKLADALGVPRVLVDIRHESSHSELPSLPLLRLAISKALDWLKSNYWEPQESAIPDIQKQIRCKLRQMVSYMKSKHVEKSKSLSAKGKRAKKPVPFTISSRLSSQLTQKLLSSKHDDPKRQISKISKVIARWYSLCPTEVTSSLLEFYMSQIPNPSFSSEGKESTVSDPVNMESFGTPVNYLKEMIIELSKKIPGLLLMLLKTVLQQIQAKEAMESSEFCPKSPDIASTQEMEHLSFLVQWLLIGLSDLKGSSLIKFIDTTQVPPVGLNTIPAVSLEELLRTCAHLSAYGNKRLSDAALFVAQMTANKPLSGRLKRLPVFGKQDTHSTTENGNPHQEYNALPDEHSLNKAKLEFAALRSRLKERSAKHESTKDGKQEGRKMWTLSKVWNTCPFGMLPCSFSSAAFLPMLDNSCELHKKKGVIVDKIESESSHLGKREGNQRPALLENPSAQKKQRELRSERMSIMDVDDSLVTSPTKGMLLINGVWKSVGEEELQRIGSNVRIMVK